jgi:hypothetical protein
MFIKRRVQFNKDDGGAGGFVTMSDVDAGDEVVLDPPKGDETDPPAGETADEKADREQKEQQAIADKAEADRKEKEKADLDAKEKEEAAKKVDTTDKGKDTLGDEELEEDEAFWAEVDKLKGGEPLEVDFGDVDPLSPEGIVIRDKAVQDDAIGKFEAYLKTTYPKSYALLAHEVAGGKVEEFFDTVGKEAELPTVAQLENDPVLQERIFTQHLKSLGNSDKMIANAIKNC